MPMAIPLVASAFSISAGLTAGGLLGGMMVAGGAIGGLGAITGNKKLMTLGSVLGLAGGVGSAMGLGEVAKNTAGDVAAKAAGDAAKATAGNTIADTTGTAVGATEAAKGALDVASDVATADQGLINNALSKTAPAAGGAPETLGAYQSPSDMALAAGTKTANASADFWSKLTNGAGSLGAGDAMTAVKNTASTLWDAGTGAIKDVSAWAEKNPNTAKIGAGLVGGAMNYMGQQQMAKDAMDRQMKYTDWVRQRYSDSVANLRIPTLSTPQGSQGIIAGSRG